MYVNWENGAWDLNMQVFLGESIGFGSRQGREMHYLRQDPP